VSRQRWRQSRVRRAEAAFQAMSLNAPLSAEPDASTLAELLGGNDPQLETSLGMEAVWAHLPELPRREQRLLAMRFYGNMTQSQIGQQLGIPQMHVSRLLAHALSYLRDQILSPSYADTPQRSARIGVVAHLRACGQRGSSFGARH
jgi:RNA polymerase sigma factor (sigma-70 family)